MADLSEKNRDRLFGLFKPATTASTTPVAKSDTTHP